MVKVATSLDVPIKLLWPKSMIFSTERGFTMLGLGDIVIPGMFVATALRYDYYRASRQGSPTSVKKTYFCAALIAYAAGLVTTMAVMHFFRKAQPALLYLRCVSGVPVVIWGETLTPSSYSPACILSFFITALARGQFNDAWAWSDEVVDKPSDETTKPNSNGEEKAVDPPVLTEHDTVPAVADASQDEVKVAPPSEQTVEGPEKKRKSKKRN